MHDCARRRATRGGFVAPNPSRSPLLSWGKPVRFAGHARGGPTEAKGITLCLSGRQGPMFFSGFPKAGLPSNLRRTLLVDGGGSSSIRIRIGQNRIESPSPLISRWWKRRGLRIGLRPDEAAQQPIGGRRHQIAFGSRSIASGVIRAFCPPLWRRSNTAGSSLLR